LPNGDVGGRYRFLGRRFTSLMDDKSVLEIAHAADGLLAGCGVTLFMPAL
jgi:hypothetical protein